MAYRSNVVIAIMKKAFFAQILLKNKPKLLNEIDSEDFLETEQCLYWRFEEIKWYQDYPEIEECESFFTNIENPDDYGISILGEDGISEHYGSPWDYGVEVYSYIGSPFGDIS